MIMAATADTAHTAHSQATLIRDNRRVVYELLVAGDEEGVTETALRDAGVCNPAAHLESLRAEGHRIWDMTALDERLKFVRRLILVEDAWA